MNRFLLMSLVGLIVLGCSHGRIKLVKVGSFKKERTSFVSSEKEEQSNVANEVVYRFIYEKDEPKVEMDSSELLLSEPLESYHIAPVTGRSREFLRNQTLKNKGIRDLNTEVSRVNGLNELNDSSIYFTGFGVLLLSFLGIRGLNNKRLKIASWAAKNKKTSLGIAVATNFALAYTGYAIGSELENMGFSISETVFHVGTTLAGATLIGMVAKNKLSRSGPFSLLTNGNQIGMMISSISLLMITASVGNNNKVNTLEAPFVASFVNEFKIDEGDEPCDELIMKDGHVLLVDILSETDNSIRYKDCGVSTLTIKSVLLSEVKEIRYNSGHTKEDHSYDNKEVDESGMSSEGILALYILFAIILTLLFAALSCAAICAWGSAGVLVLIALVLILALYNWGMSNAYVNRRRIEAKIN